MQNQQYAHPYITLILIKKKQQQTNKTKYFAEAGTFNYYHQENKRFSIKPWVRDLKTAVSLWYKGRSTDNWRYRVMQTEGKMFSTCLDFSYILESVSFLCRVEPIIVSFISKV